jgi:hypothetical protein
MLDKFGRVLLFMFFVVLAVIGSKMIFKIADPYTRKVSGSFADTLANI